MKAMQKLRRRISRTLVENNAVLVDEMKNYNVLYGRRETVWGRLRLVTGLYYQYGLLKQHPLESKERSFFRVQFPESKDNQNIEIEDIFHKIKEKEVLIIDFFDVMVNTALKESLLLSLLEVFSGHIGLADTTKDKTRWSEKEKEVWLQLIVDFSVKNEFIIKVWEEARKRGIKTAIRNNSRDLDDRDFEIILSRMGIHGEIYSNDVEKAIFLTEKGNKDRDIIYPNINILGDKYRTFWKRNTVTALYCQIVNSKFHSQAKEYPLFYEYGFTCGGILICGFCIYLNELAKKEKIDKFIFVARDGDIIQKIYQRYYEQQKHEYLVFSRFSSYELIFEDFPEEYIDKNIKTRIYRYNTDNSIRKVLQECHLEVIEDCITTEGMDLNEQLCEENYEQLKDILLKYKSTIQEEFRESCNAAEQYILHKVGNSKKVCIVDVGWHGKSIVYLKHLLENKYQWNGEVIGAMIGAVDNASTQNHIRRGIINTYGFENDYWRRQGKDNGEPMSYEETICIESLFSSEAPTFLRYKYNEKGKVDFIYGKEHGNKERIKQVHEGILNFSEKFTPIIKKYNMQITVRDAYTPLDYMVQNESFRGKIMSEYEEVPNAINGFVNN